MILSELIPFLSNLGKKPKKSLSQNFLIDPNICQKIIQTAHVQKEDPVLEIGPGPGSLTEPLLAKGARLFAVELDEVFAEELKRFESPNLFIYHSDILKFPLHSLPSSIKVVANLPYHITTPILEKLFSLSCKSITIMVQKELAERMRAKSGTKAFGPLSLFVQFHATIQTSFDVPPTCFYPRPKVCSTVVHMTLKPPPFKNASFFFSLVRTAFQKRRKMLIHSLGVAKEEAQNLLESLGLRKDARAEALSLDDWVRLSEKLLQLVPDRCSDLISCH